MKTGHGIAAAEGQARKTGRRRSVAARARGDARLKNTVGEKRRRKEAHKERKKLAKQAARGAAGDEAASGEAAID